MAATFLRRLLTCAPVPVLLVAPLLVASSQEPTAVRGHVRDSAGAPVPGATISANGHLTAAVSDAGGRFRLTLDSGLRTLSVRKLGFAPYEIELAPHSDTGIVIVLRRAPLTLRAVTVQGEGTPPMGHSITRAMVRQTPALGEPDVFRSLMLAPGVSQPNDLKGSIHLEGGASDETGVLLNGHPLMDPFHIYGALGAVNLAALERADVAASHLPASSDGRLGGMIFLESRQIPDSIERETTLSIVSASVTAVRPERRLPGLLVSGRLTYLDRIMALTVSHDPNRDNLIAPNFRDLMLTAEKNFGGWNGQLTGFHTLDRRNIVGNVRSGYDPLEWGESLVGVRATRRGSGWNAEVRASGDWGSLREYTPRDARDPNSRSQSIDVDRRLAVLAAEYTRTAPAWTASGGIGLDARRNSQHWENLLSDWLTPNTPRNHRSAGEQTLIRSFVSHGRAFGTRTRVTAGSHLTVGRAGGFVSPRLLVEQDVLTSLRISMGADRRHQFDTQIEEPIEWAAGVPSFLLNRPRRVDMLAMSARWSPHSQGLLSYSLATEAFARKYTERTILARSVDVDSAPILFDRIPGRAMGASLDATLGIGQGTFLQARYSWQRVREKADSVYSPASWDVPHSFMLLASTSIARRWHMSGLLQTRTGVPGTPITGYRIIGNDLEYFYGPRNSVRVPPYLRLDMGLRRTFVRQRSEWALSLNAHNILRRENFLAHHWWRTCSDSACDLNSRLIRPGLPLVPSIGLEVRW